MANLTAKMENMLQAIWKAGCRVPSTGLDWRTVSALRNRGLLGSEGVFGTHTGGVTVFLTDEGLAIIGQPSDK